MLFRRRAFYSTKTRWVPTRHKHDQRRLKMIFVMIQLLDVKRLRNDTLSKKINFQHFYHRDSKVLTFPTITNSFSLQWCKNHHQSLSHRKVLACQKYFKCRKKGFDVRVYEMTHCQRKLTFNTFTIVIRKFWYVP